MKRKYFRSVIVLLVPVLMAGSCSEKTTTRKKTGDNPANTAAKEVPAANNPDNKSKMVIIKTEYGDMKIRLYDETPLHRDNFIKLVNEGYYNDLLFHRIIKSFMIQGGDPNSRGAAPGAQLGMGGPGYTIPAEFNPKLFHKKGALAAARMGDQMNPKKESSGSQFYIVQGQVYTAQQLQSFPQLTPEQITTYTTVGGVPFLDNQYTVFGEVTEGLDVIDKIAAVQTAPGDRPVKDVKMQIVSAK